MFTSMSLIPFHILEKVLLLNEKHCISEKTVTKLLGSEIFILNRYMSVYQEIHQCTFYH